MFVLFYSGKPSALFDQNHPDWAPTKLLGYTSFASACKDDTLSRYERAKIRAKKVRQSLEEQKLTEVFDNKENVFTSNNSVVNNHDCDSVDTKRSSRTVEIQTDTSVTDSFPSPTWFEQDQERVHFYCGLPNLTIFMAILDLIGPGLIERKKLDKFQQLLLILMRLRLNLSVQDLGYRFGIHSSTVSKVFQSCIHTMFTAMKFLVRWPQRDELRLTMPLCFKEKFSSCAVIIDCFEVFIERPSCLLARSQTWSSYKHHNTAKYLIGITPQGTVSYISSGWGGRASDKYITEHWGLLENLQPGDLVLADRGFDIEESCALHAAQLQIPSFTKGKAQLSPVEIETTRNLANVRIHVERVIGCVRQKYTILGHGIIPIPYMMSDRSANTCLLDEITFVCCALTNCCKSIIIATG